MNKKGLGVAMLMMFIAFLLAALIASVVMITQIEELAIKTTTVGKEITKNVATMISVTAIEGQNGTDGSIENLTIYAHHSSDTFDIDLRALLLTIELDDDYREYRYNASYDFSTGENTRQFGVYYMQGPTGNVGMLARDDIIRISLWAPRPIVAENMMFIRFIPKLGTETVMKFRVPYPVFHDVTTIYVQPVQ